MKKKSLLIFQLLISGVVLGQSVLPEVMSTAGDHFTSNDAQVSWTIGETVIESLENANNQLTQGFHQTNLILTSILDLAKEYNVEVFPNPTNDIITVQWKENVGKHSLDLYDNTGKRIYRNLERKADMTDIINVSDLASGSYFLLLSMPKDNSIQIFKIIKI